MGSYERRYEVQFIHVLIVLNEGVCLNVPPLPAPRSDQNGVVAILADLALNVR